jgi:hypothetical protein
MQSVNRFQNIYKYINASNYPINPALSQRIPVAFRSLTLKVSCLVPVTLNPKCWCDYFSNTSGTLDMYHAFGGCGGTNVFLVGDSNIEGGESVVLSSPTPPSRPLLKQDFIHGACIQRPSKSRWVYRSAGELWVLALRPWSHSGARYRATPALNRLVGISFDLIISRNGCLY